MLGTLLSPKGEPTELAVRILSCLGVQHDGSLADIVRATQTAFVPKRLDTGRALERAEVILPVDWEKCRTSVFPLLHEAGFVDEVLPVHLTQVDTVLAPGGYVFRMAARLALLDRMFVSRGFEAYRVALLAGERPLDTNDSLERVAEVYPDIGKILNRTVLPEFGTTEATAMNALLHSLLCETLEFMDQNGLVDRISPPMYKKDGKMVRPTFEDTLRAWQKATPGVVQVCLVTSQPSLLPQTLTLYTVLGFGYQMLEVYAPAAPVGIRMQDLLREFAGTFYWAEKCLNTHGALPK